MEPANEDSGSPDVPNSSGLQASVVPIADVGGLADVGMVVAIIVCTSGPVETPSELSQDNAVPDFATYMTAAEFTLDFSTAGVVGYSTCGPPSGEMCLM
jgi:hypothetical protein